MKILFLDIDGVVLPGRAYCLPNQTNDPFVTIFDPCSVALLNKLCESEGLKIVVHSSWIRTKFMDNIVGSVKNHCIGQGIKKEHFHEDWSCDGDIDWRYNRIRAWIAKHPEIDNWVALDDSPPSETDEWAVSNTVVTDFDEGITRAVIIKAAEVVK